MMTQCAEGYITMTADDSGAPLPAGLMSCWHHSDDMPTALCRTRSIIENIEASGSMNRPRKLLHLQVIESHKTCLMKMLLITHMNFLCFFTNNAKHYK
jgi:hypothetical protein